jgi:tetratricopeptide (TPR) repeat protein
MWLALNARGTALMIDDRDHEAIADFGAAVARDPNFASAFANRGYLLNRLGRFEAASPILPARSRLRRTTPTSATTPRWCSCCTANGAKAGRISNPG